MGLGSGIRKKPIPDPGSRDQKGTGSRTRIRKTDHWYRYVLVPTSVPDPLNFLACGILLLASEKI
jgi:hypothetical protein